VAEENYNVLTENVLVDLEEKIICQISKEGDISKYEVKGKIFVTLTDPKKTHSEIQFKHNSVKGLSFKVHPDLDKQAWSK
jgi:hypothetical protein